MGCLRAPVKQAITNLCNVHKFYGLKRLVSIRRRSYCIHAASLDKKTPPRRDIEWLRGLHTRIYHKRCFGGIYFLDGIIVDKKGKSLVVELIVSDKDEKASRWMSDVHVGDVVKVLDVREANMGTVIWGWLLNTRCCCKSTRLSP